MRRHGKRENDSLNLAMKADIVSMDVHKTTNDYLVPMNVFDTLFEVAVNDDGSTSIKNSLAEDYSISDDGLTYDITLRDKEKFSYGIEEKLFCSK